MVHRHHSWVGLLVASLLWKFAWNLLVPWKLVLDIEFLILLLPPECGFFGTRDEIQELFILGKPHPQPIGGDVRDLCLEVDTCEGPIIRVILALTATPEAGFHLSFSFPDKWTEGGHFRWCHVVMEMTVKPQCLASFNWVWHVLSSQHCRLRPQA